MGQSKGNSTDEVGSGPIRRGGGAPTLSAADADLCGLRSGYGSLIEKLPACFTLLREDGTVVFANAAATAFTGHEVSELEGRRFWPDTVHPEDRWKLTKAQRDAWQGERPSIIVRILSRRSDPRLAEMHLFRTAVDRVPLIGCTVFDLTEMNEMEEALFQSEALYRIFLEQSPIGMLHLDARGTVTFENHRFRQIVGEDAEDAWIGRSVGEIERMDARGRGLVDEMLALGHPIRGETVPYRGRSGEPRLLQLHGSPIRHPEDGIVGGVLMIEDRTEERRRKEELDLRSRYASAESELRKAALSDRGREGFLEEAARVIGQSTEACRVRLLMNNAAGDCCMPRAEWVRKGLNEAEPLVVMHHDEPVLASLTADRSCIHVHGGDGGDEAEVLLDKTGAREAMWLSVFEESRLSGLVVLERIEDGSMRSPGKWSRTERRLIERLVRLMENLWSWMQADQRYRQISATIDDCLFTFTYDEDGERRYLFLTPQVSTLTGHSVEDVLSSDRPASRWSDVVVHDEDQTWVDRHDEALRSGREGRVTYRVRHRGGSIRWLREHATPETDAMGDVIVSGILTDVTAQKEAEDVLTEARKQAESANRLKSAFVATMSHEIRTPMGAVNGFAELLARELVDLEAAGVDLPPQVNEFLEAVRENLKRLLMLVNDLFDLSNLEVGSMELRRASVPFNEIVRRVAKRAAAPLARNGVRLELDLAPADLLVLGDAQRVEQVMDNLLSNAVKFTQEGYVRVSTGAEGDWVVARVADTGVGIAEEHLDRLFDPFVQEDSRLNRRFGGSGLGLSLVKRLLALMDGRIDVESKKDEGSTFTIWLPRDRVDADFAPGRR